MNAIPAKVAGVERLVMVTPTPGGEVNQTVMAAAHLAGVDEIWRVGGAQAIAALAYGTDRIRPVDVITGPGNAWVAEANANFTAWWVSIWWPGRPKSLWWPMPGTTRMDRRRLAEPGRA